MKTYTVKDHQREITFTGEVIARDTSHDPLHTHAGDYLTPGKGSCPACRWFEVTLYATDEDDYVIYTVGRSILPGEIDFAKVSRTDSAFEMVDILTVRHRNGPFLPAPSSRALAQAAKHDDEIRDAYVNRAVV